ncbi:sensor histidine kinase [Paraflavitalea pollutisoli]|uniref:sensor histidine kinase n=1 Tax=Paraflavitalea pollutisoli TaxID=3034143 RepID=UPI0023ED551C|nr:sensor histidine kinase [Paraflavitalea sp. H1-2-19X]
MRKAALSVAFWGLFFLSWQQVVYFYVDNIVNRLLFTAFDVSQVILVFYITYSIITPRFFHRRRQWLFAGALLVTVVLASLLLHYTMLFFLRRAIIPIRFNFTWTYHSMMANRYLIALLGALAGLIVKLSVQWLQARRTLAETEKRQIAAELLYLKTQVNPHFLFNAINTVYIQIDESTEAAKHTLSAFSDMLRYQLYECNQEKIPIEKEVTYLQHYLTLQQLRLDERYQLQVDFDDHLKGFQLAPFVLMPLVENMFKHAGGQPPILIQGNLRYEGGVLYFYSINSIDAGGGQPGSGGIGLANLQRRLELIYPGRHSLTTRKGAEQYEVWLTLQPI